MEPENRIPALVFTHPGVPLPTPLQHGLLDALAYALIPWYGYLPSGALAITATIVYSNHKCDALSMSTTGHDDAHRYTRYEIMSLMGYAADIAEIARGILSFLSTSITVEYTYNQDIPYVVPTTMCWVYPSPSTITL